LGLNPVLNRTLPAQEPTEWRFAHRRDKILFFGGPLRRPNRDHRFKIVVAAPVRFTRNSLNVSPSQPLPTLRFGTGGWNPACSWLQTQAPEADDHTDDHEEAAFFLSPLPFAALSDLKQRYPTFLRYSTLFCHQTGRQPVQGSGTARLYQRHV